MGRDIRITVTKAPALDDQAMLAAVNHLQSYVNDLQFDTDGPGSWWVAATSKYEPEGVENFADAASTRYPTARVTVAVEWDTRDADEAGAYEYVYLAGTKCHQRVAGLVPADLEPSIASLRAALVGDGDVRAAARWLADGLDGIRPDEEPQSAPPTVVSVTVTDRWGTDHSAAFSAVFDYSTVTEARGIELLTAPGWGDRRLTSTTDASPILDGWIESAEEHTNYAYGYTWEDSWGAYVLPYWDGEATGYLSISDDGEGRGAIAFETFALTLDLTVQVTWSNSTPAPDAP